MELAESSNSESCYELTDRKLVKFLEKALCSYDGTEGEYADCIKKHANIRVIKYFNQNINRYTKITSPLDIALQAENINSVRLLLEQSEQAVHYLTQKSSGRLTCFETMSEKTMNYFFSLRRLPVAFVQKVFDDAVIDDKISIVRSLIHREDIDVNKQIFLGKTPLELARCLGRGVLERILLQHKNIHVAVDDILEQESIEKQKELYNDNENNRKDSHEKDPLQEQGIDVKNEKIELSVEVEAIEEKAHKAIYSNDIDKMQQLIGNRDGNLLLKYSYNRKYRKKRPPFECRTDPNQTVKKLTRESYPLHYALDRGYTEIVTLLIKNKKTDIKVSKDGQTALERAVSLDNAYVIRALRECENEIDINENREDILKNNQKRDKYDSSYNIKKILTTCLLTSGCFVLILLLYLYNSSIFDWCKI